MVLGFLSLVLTVSIGVLSKICIPASYGKIMLPCKFDYGNKDDGDRPYKEDDNHDGGHDHDKRKLLSLAADMMQRRSLAASGPDDYCSKHVRPPPKTSNTLLAVCGNFFVLLFYGFQDIDFDGFESRGRYRWSLGPGCTSCTSSSLSWPSFTFSTASSRWH